MRALTLAGTLAGLGILALAACNSAPSLPPADQESFPAPQETRDWEAWGEDRPDTPPTSGRGAGPVQVIGTRLSGEEIRRALTGQVLNGCYPNGERFAERLAENGRFYDANDNDRELGTWSVKNDALCFDYPQQGESCFPVSREGSDLFFYAQDFSGIVAATRCS